jgi:hypothetical protein
MRTGGNGPPPQRRPSLGAIVSGMTGEKENLCSNLSDWLRWGGMSNGSGLPSDGSKDTQVPREVEQITVSLAAKAADDLRRVATRTNLTQTDIVNRALSMYEFIDAELTEGAELIVRKEGRDFVVKVL